MLTPQEVSGRSFTKAVMGGYNMTMVDEFLDELTDDYTTLYKENASLKAKLKVLVEKVEEYRATEDSMRATLLTAQRMADSIVKEAEAKRDEILGQAESNVRERLDEYRRELAQSDERLRQGHLELQKFIAASRELCDKEMQFLDKLPELIPELPTPDASLEQIEENVRSAFAEPPAEVPAAPAATAAPDVPAAPVPPAAPAKLEIPTPEPAQAPQVKEVPEPKPVEEKPDLDATRRVNLNDLKFGPNYRGDAR